eukprot:CAMPEP_0170470064 /NCGR_PEP_ID=MMETSP0123-20130129/12655_1 /TAXON_ID=182087 /ORGANISM="Favella ehrenbergii, Strain Fehren 1" /LENGTH=40 /DNA_ID= /DNA_START= /DNA_END= /DNA_ORIENTATION=
MPALPPIPPSLVAAVVLMPPNESAVPFPACLRTGEKASWR